ncbi:TonB-dependent hemoglobin/transferrin/lactoferrin family receptor [Providencia burhodogranariea]|uniref:TonB-dependent heme/hemoglobin receptor family protein n=1 Tax=Providencia burhodogranariea DSM 19968 TaxID=1141662 RepID=K8WIB1_9GAMM|nr:TonB-dependent hemoglobin/transferrin/lactoferrin family receptor [Providencia burhodogranariea]EKT60279.1 TonB-dependent heme/hemoglobin receptor family protein [Providencia burhodogranariea DSM 19968]
MTQKKHHYKKAVLCVHLALMALPAVPIISYAQTEQSPQVISFSVPAQSLERALIQYAQQAKVEILIDTQDVAGLKSYAIQGNLSLKEGLRQLIGSNPIRYSIQNNRISISRIPATSNDDSVVVLDKITVTAAPVQQGDWVYDAPTSVSVISKKQIEDRPPKHIADLLELTTGVYSAVSQQDPSLSVNIRGIQDYGRVNMNIDGMRQNFQKSGHGQRNGSMYIDSELLSGVEILKGNSSGMGSGGTLGGVATFRTVNASDFLSKDKTFGGKLNASTGSNNTHFIGSTALALGNEKGDILFAASERRLGDYMPGTHGSIGDIRINNDSGHYDQLVDDLKHTRITDSNYHMTSYLAKAGWNISESQRIQFNYLETKVASPNAGTLTNLTPSWPYKLGWKKSGFSDVNTKNYSLDYTQFSNSPWSTEFKGKIYLVDTKDDSKTYATSQLINNGYQSDTRVKTIGLQLENHSEIEFNSRNLLKAHYGLETFQDKASSRSTEASAENVTPDGKRSLSSLFATLTYEYDDWLTLEGGMRYDYYNLKGKTGMRYSIYPYTKQNPCTAIRISGCKSVEVNKVWDVDDSEGAFSPNARLAIRPNVEWMELFTSYGRSWRPPAITETLTTGSAHSSSTQFPNPYLKPERSNAWEVGMNVNYPNLVLEEDRLLAKVAYFDTRVDNYINLAINRTKPGLLNPSMGNAAYSNNLNTTRFRGFEYQVNYDAGFVYADLTFTHMIGKNKFCAHPAWLGGTLKYGGGRGNWYVEDDELTNNYVDCNSGAIFGSAANLPGDRGSFTLGGRAFDRKLDGGVVVRFTPGFQDYSAQSNYPYLADWPKYTVVDLYASYALTNDITIRGNVENLTNRAYVVSYAESLSNTLGRGRTISGGIEYRF